MLSFFNNVVYVQLSPALLTVRNPKTGQSISERPEIAIATEGGKAKIVGVGAMARSLPLDASVNIVNPFAHPRSLVSDFTVAEQVLKAFIKRLGNKTLFSVSPVVVMHPLGDPEGGLTQIEIRALREMGLGTGASGVKVWQGRTLMDAELMARQFPPDGQVLE